MDLFLNIKNMPIMLVGNKCDLELMEWEKFSGENEIEKIEDAEILGHFEVSAKNNINIEESFKKLITHIQQQPNFKQSIKNAHPKHQLNQTMLSE